MRELTLDEVRRLLDAAIAHARAEGHPSSIAVVDMGGHLRGALRPEKGRIANLPIAEKKAWTAVAFQRPTHMLTERLSPGGSGYGLVHTDPRICIVPGGYPILDEDGDVIGGIGASGAPAAEDQETCLAALRAAGFPVSFADPLSAAEPPVKAAKTGGSPPKPPARRRKPTRSTTPRDGKPPPGRGRRTRR